MNPAIATSVDTFLRVILGMGLSFLIVVSFIAAAWYVPSVTTPPTCLRFITWRISLSKVPFFRDLMSMAGSKKSQQ